MLLGYEKDIKDMVIRSLSMKFSSRLMVSNITSGEQLIKMEKLLNLSGMKRKEFNPKGCQEIVESFRKCAWALVPAQLLGEGGEVLNY